MTGIAGDGNPTGTVTVQAGATTLCTDATLTNSGTFAATFSCPISSATLLAASGTAYSVTASFGGGASSNTNFAYTTSTSTPAQNLTVNKASAGTTTSLTVSPTTINYGSETSETLSGTVTGITGDGNPTGTVTVQAGATTLCTGATLTNSGTFAATFSCPISSATLLGASGTAYSVTASFGGGASSNTNFTYTASTSAAQSLTVNPAPVGTTTSLTMSPTTVTYGSENSVTLSGTVTGATGDGNPTGTVTVQVGATTLCTDATLTNSGTFAATFSCPISSATLLAASGTAYSVTASFGGGATSSTNFIYTASTSNPAQNLTVNKASAATTTSLTVAPTTINYGSETGVTLSGTVTGVTGDGNPTGTVTVQAGATTLCTDATLTNSGTFAATFSCPISSDTLLGASGTAYSVTASFGGGASSNTNFTYTTSTSTPAQNLTVNKASAATTTSLTVAPTTINYGSETGVTLSGTVTGITGDGNPTGTVTVQAGATTLCTDATLTNSGTFAATFSCPISSATLLAASGTAYSVTASFGGGATSNTNFTYAASTSTPAQSLTVNPAPVGTTTSLTMSPTTVTYGSETGVTLSGTVTGIAGDGNPTGTVTVQAGATTLCTDATLTNSGTFAATFSCPISSATLLAASGTAYSVTASFGGGASSNTNFAYTTSTSTPAQNLTVNKASAGTTTSLTVSPTTINYGSETSETLSGTVTGITGDGNPTGTVTVQAGATTLCTGATLTNSGTFAATFSCPISSATLLGASGTAYSVTASFGGGASSNTNFTYTASTSAAQSLTVNPAPVGTTTSLTMSPTTVTYGSENSVTLSGTVTGATGDGNPTGTVTVQVGATTLCTDATLTNSGTFAATFSCPISSATLLAASGTAYSVTASYGGGASSNTNFTYTTSTSTPAQNLTVNTAAVGTTTTLNAITSPITYGSEASETFSGTVTGVNGDGNPTGTVTVQTGATTLCTGHLDPQRHLRGQLQLPDQLGHAARGLGHRLLGDRHLSAAGRLRTPTSPTRPRRRRRPRASR